MIFTLDTVDVDSHVHSRFFSPYYDVIEDPVTGSANGPLAVYLLKSGLIKDTKLIKAEQGDILGRPGRLSIAVDEQYQSKLVGKAVTVLEGEILIPSFRA